MAPGRTIPHIRCFSRRNQARGPLGLIACTGVARGTLVLVRSAALSNNTKKPRRRKPAVLPGATRKQTAAPPCQENADGSNHVDGRRHQGKRATADRMVAQSYVVFEARFARDLFCAVPKSHPIPDFLIGAGWTFRGTLSRHWSSLGGFEAVQARAAIERDGFFLFAASLGPA